MQSYVRILAILKKGRNINVSIKNWGIYTLVAQVYPSGRTKKKAGRKREREGEN